VKTSVFLVLAGLSVFCVAAAEKPGAIDLPAKTAKIAGPDAAYDEGSEYRCIRSWKTTNVVLRWSFTIPAKGAYRMFINYSAPHTSDNSEALIECGNQRASFFVKSTGDWRRFVEADLGPILFRKPGEAELTLRVTAKMPGSVWDFRSLRLVPED
jgi:hypothetical protein